MPRRNGTRIDELDPLHGVEYNPNTNLVYLYELDEYGRITKLITLAPNARRALAQWLENNDLS